MRELVRQLEGVDATLEAQAKRIAELEAALRDLSMWDRKPWIDMADPIEDQLRDMHHALKTACTFARIALSR